MDPVVYTPQENPRLRAALRYARRGWRVFLCHWIEAGQCSCKRPCPPNRAGKHPLTPHGVKDATTDETQIIEWGDNYPNANVAIATGAESGFIVIDVDPRHGGDVSLAALEDEFGMLPVTVEAATGGGGGHFLFAHPGGVVRNNRDRLGAGIDIKADGGYIIASPSNHVSGGQYEWEPNHGPDDIPLAPMPLWLIEKLTASTVHPKVTSRMSSSSGRTRFVSHQFLPGTRNIGLTGIAGSLLNDGCRDDALVAELQSINRRQCLPPLDDQEVEKIARSMQRTHDHNKGRAAGGSTQRDLILDMMAYALTLTEEWRGSRGKTDLATLLGLYRTGYDAAALVFSASYRQLADHAGVGLKPTYTAVQRLIRRDWVTIEVPYRQYFKHLAQQKEPVEYATNCYRLAVPSAYRKNTTVNPLSSGLLFLLLSFCGSDAFRRRGLGKSTLLVMAALAQGPAESFREITRRVSVSEDTARRCIRNLQQHNLIIVTDQGYELTEIETQHFTTIAEIRGTAGTGTRQRQWHEHERVQYRRRLRPSPSRKTKPVAIVDDPPSPVWEGETVNEPTPVGPFDNGRTDPSSRNSVSRRCDTETPGSSFPHTEAEAQDTPSVKQTVPCSDKKTDQPWEITI
ncbi:MAG: bifunctional DNA primase/polymerase [Candidatus Binatia bacterium]